MFFKSLKPILVAMVILGAAVAGHAQQKNWHVDAGFGSRNMTPLVLVTGISYKNVGIRVQGLGQHSGANDFWCGVRGSLLWTFFRDLPFRLDLGVGSGYEYAEAPNMMHKDLNKANKGTFLLPYNYVENMDISAEVWTHLYGFYTQISIPAYRFYNHDAPTLLAGIGYLIRF